MKSPWCAFHFVCSVTNTSHLRFILHGHYTLSFGWNDVWRCCAINCTSCWTSRCICASASHGLEWSVWLESQQVIGSKHLFVWRIRIARSTLRKMSTLETSQRECSSTIFERFYLDPIYRESLSYERPKRKYWEVWDHITATQTNTDPKFQLTKTEREALWTDRRIANVENRDASHT